ncbi:ROK family protein [Oscillospiraceae bacterium PP1C4]
MPTMSIPSRVSGKQKKIYLGIDIGGTMIKWGLMDATGTILENGMIATEVPRGQQQFLDKLLGIIANADERQIAGVGISTAGIVDSHAGTIIDGIQNIPFLKKLNLKEYLEARTGLPVRVLNDVKAAALGEKWIGAGRNCENFFCMTIGTGIGGCLVIDSHVFEGAHFRAGEIGYLDYEDEQHFFEKRFSTKGLIETAQCELGLPEISGSEFFTKIRQDDPNAVAIFDRWISRIVKAIATVIILFDPEKIIIGGGITEQGSLLLDPINNQLAHCLPDGFAQQCTVELAACRNDAGILGAVYFLMEDEL